MKHRVRRTHTLPLLHDHCSAESVLLSVLESASQHQGEGVEQVSSIMDHVLLPYFADGMAGLCDHVGSAIHVFVATQGLQEDQGGCSDVVAFQEVHGKLELKP